MLADALGGSCGLQSPPEIGIFEVELTEAGVRDPIFSGMTPRQTCLQWHLFQVTELPEDAEILASSPLCTVQAMRVGRNAWSMQYHVEVEPDTVENWGRVPAYRSALEHSLGEGSLERLKSEAAERMQDFRNNSSKLYENFRSAAGL